MENLEPIKNIEPEIDLEKIAQEYSEKLRSEISEFKKREIDPHLKNIDPDKLTYDDLIIYDKAKKYQLTPHEFQSYSEKLQQYFREQRISEKKREVEELRNKFKNKEITSEEFDKQYKNLLYEEDEKRKISGKDYISVSQTDSRANFAAMIRNKLVGEEDIKRHLDNPIP